MSSDRDAFNQLVSDVRKFLRQQEELHGEVILPLRNEPSPGSSPRRTVVEPSREESLFPEASRPASAVSETSSGEWTGAADLRSLEQFICTCTKCALGHTRTKFVFGVGNPNADLVLVGEAPGAEEDAQGEPFVGRAGQLLNKILEAIRFRREDVYICNILKCRPPNNRDPLPDEVALCEPYLWKQLELIRPKVILCLGRIAAQVLLKTSESLTSLRGRVHDYRGIRLMVTYHPAALLRNPNWKRPAWEDVQKLRRLYDELTAGTAS